MRQRTRWMAIGLALAATAVALAASPVSAQTSADVPGLTTPPWGAWHTEQVDGKIADPGEIAFTNDGEPRIAYHRAFNGVRFAEPTSTGWSSELIETQAGDVSLAVDQVDRALVGYAESFPRPSEVQLAWRDAGEEDWTIEVVDEGVNPAMALDPEWTPHFVYKALTENRHELRHAERTGAGAYEGETLTDAPKSSSYFHDPRLAIAPDGALHSVFDEPNGDTTQARHAAWDPATEEWSFTWLPVCQFGSDQDLAVDPDGGVHVACLNAAHGLIHYHRAPGEDAWTWQVAATGEDAVPPRPDGRIGQDVAVAAGPDNVHITWRTTYNPLFPDNPTTPMHLYYTAGQEGNYTTEPVNNRGTGIGSESAVTVDEEGRPWVSYEFNWRSRTLPSEELVNPRFELWLAHPASALPGRTVTSLT